MEEENLEGLGGWLSLVGLSLVFSPPGIAVANLVYYRDFFANNTWSILTTPGTEASNYLLATVIITQAVVNIVALLVSILLVVLFLWKKRMFPKVFIGSLVIASLYAIAVLWGIHFLAPDIPVLNYETIKNLGISILSAVVLVAYMILSKRVKETFIR